MREERLFAALLHLCPKSFRQEYGDAMLTTFRDLRAAPGEPPRGLRRFIVADMVQAAATLWWDECQHSFAVRWLTTCAVGLLSVTVVANLVARVFSYLYHPYLEGFTLSASAFGAFLGVVLGGTIAMSQWRLLPRQNTRSWALASGLALPIAALLCGTVVNRAVIGMNPIADQSMHDALTVWIGAFDQPDSLKVAIEFGAMALSAAVFAVTTRRRMERRHAA
jgi:hypothetical protein